MSGLMQRPYIVYFFSVIISLLFSLWSGTRVSMINTDAICYLQSAETMSQGWRAATQLCDQATWPFYSLLIALLVNYCSVTTLTAANMLDGIFAAMTVAGFIAVVSRLSTAVSHHTRQRILWLAALVILSSHEFNSIKYYVVRDHGFWAFYVLSLLGLLHYIQSRQVWYAFAWSISLIVATLFRIEGAVFLVFLPISLWFMPDTGWHARLKMFIQLNIPLFFLGLSVVIAMVFFGSEQLGRVNDLFFQMTHGVTLLSQQFSSKATSLATHVLSIHAVSDASLVLFIVLIVWYVIAVVSNLGAIYTVLLIYAWYKKVFQVDKKDKSIVIAYLVINVLITGIFLAENMFLSKRYLLAMSLILMLWVPFALENLLKEWRQRRWVVITVISFMLMGGVSGLIEFGHSKKYIYDAGDWLSKNTEANASVYVNDISVMYYSHLFGNDIFKKAKQYQREKIFDNNNWQHYQFVVMRQSGNDPAITEQLDSMKLTLVRVFANKRGDRVVIYKRSL